MLDQIAANSIFTDGVEIFSEVQRMEKLNFLDEKLSYLGNKVSTITEEGYKHLGFPGDVPEHIKADTSDEGRN
ncbi:hypothetical protein [Deinococcus sp.]|uniref:hypothetical protein n=1 Tax=Deinococcus sp. TaxID=47478 RepID=UPI003B59276F